jgi:hypothetical protein
MAKKIAKYTLPKTEAELDALADSGGRQSRSAHERVCRHPPNRALLCQGLAVGALL